MKERSPRAMLAHSSPSSPTCSCRWPPRRRHSGVRSSSRRPRCACSDCDRPRGNGGDRRRSLAARPRHRTPEWNVGSSLACGQANYSGDAFVFCVQETSVVGSYPANAWGLHDMHGNVQELCRDGWDGTSGYAADAVVDPFVPSGLFRVLRGGGWSLGSDFCRSAHRGTIVPPFWANNAGFRVVCAPVR